MPTTIIRQALGEDIDTILELNSESEAVLSPLSRPRYAELTQQAAVQLVATIDSRVEAFLMAYTSGADYDSANYLWFDARYDNYCYIDRVVVATASRGLGLGRALYAELASRASALHRSWLLAEIVCEPPNTASLRFHQRMGFSEVATRQDEHGKILSMQQKRLKPGAHSVGPV